MLIQPGPEYVFLTDDADPSRGQFVRCPDCRRLHAELNPERLGSADVLLDHLCRCGARIVIRKQT